MNEDDKPAATATVAIATNTSDTAPCDSAVNDDEPAMNKHMYHDDDDDDDEHDVTPCSRMTHRLIFRTIIMVYNQALWLSFKNTCYTFSCLFNTSLIHFYVFPSMRRVSVISG